MWDESISDPAKPRMQQEVVEGKSVALALSTKACTELMPQHKVTG